MTAIYCLYFYRVKIINNNLNDFYGNGIILKRCAFSRVDENYLTDCSASGMASIDTDYQGDGNTAFLSFSIKVTNDTIINRRLFKVHHKLVKDIYGLQCGRSGLEFEYGVDADVKKTRTMMSFFFRTCFKYDCRI